MTKLLRRMHQLSFNILCSSDYQMIEKFCEIKHPFSMRRRAREFIFISYFERDRIFYHQVSFLGYSINYMSYRFDLSFLVEERCAIMWERVFFRLTSTELILAFEHGKCVRAHNYRCQSSKNLSSLKNQSR